MGCVGFILLLFALVFAQACTDRLPHAVGLLQANTSSVVQPQDQSMDCNAIFAEIHGNTLKMSDSINQLDLWAAQKVRTGSLWFKHETQEFEDKEVRVLQLRQQYLLSLLEQKQC